MLVGRLNYATRGIRRCGGAVALANNAAAPPLATAGLRTMATATDDSAVFTGMSRRAARFPSSVHTSRSTLSTPMGRAFSTDGKKIIPFVLADIGEGIAEVELLQWFVSEGDSVHQFDNICEVQSDKATVEISSRYDGVVKNVHFTVGDMVQVGSALVDIEIDAEEGDDDAAPTAKAGDVAKEPAAAAPAAVAAAPAAVASEPVAANREILTTPAVRKIAKENSVDLAHVPGTGPNGRILKEDILSFIAGGGAAPAPAAAAAAAAAASELPSAAAAAAAPPAPSKALPSRAALAPNSSRTEQVSGAYGVENCALFAQALLIDHTLCPGLPSLFARYPTNHGSEHERISQDPAFHVQRRGELGLHARCQQGSIFVRTLATDNCEAGLMRPCLQCSRFQLSFDDMVSLRASLKDVASGYGIRLSYLPILIKAVSIALSDHEVLNSSLSDDEVRAGKPRRSKRRSFLTLCAFACTLRYTVHHYLPRRPQHRRGNGHPARLACSLR